MGLEPDSVIAGSPGVLAIPTISGASLWTQPASGNRAVWRQASLSELAVNSPSQGARCYAKGHASVD